MSNSNCVFHIAGSKSFLKYCDLWVLCGSFFNMYFGGCLISWIKKVFVSKYLVMCILHKWMGCCLLIWMLKLFLVFIIPFNLSLILMRSLWIVMFFLCCRAISMNCGHFWTFYCQRFLVLKKHLMSSTTS